MNCKGFEGDADRQQIKIRSVFNMVTITEKEHEGGSFVVGTVMHELEQLPRSTHRVHPRLVLIEDGEGGAYQYMKFELAAIL